MEREREKYYTQQNMSLLVCPICIFSVFYGLWLIVIYGGRGVGTRDKFCITGQTRHKLENSPCDVIWETLAGSRHQGTSRLCSSSFQGQIPDSPIQQPVSSSRVSVQASVVIYSMKFQGKALRTSREPQQFQVLMFFQAQARDRS